MHRLPAGLPHPHRGSHVGICGVKGFRVWDIWVKGFRVWDICG